MTADRDTLTLAAAAGLLAAVVLAWAGAALACLTCAAAPPTLPATAAALPRLLAHPGLGPGAWQPAFRIPAWRLAVGEGVALAAALTISCWLLRRRLVRGTIRFPRTAPGITRRLPALTVARPADGRITLGTAGRSLIAAEAQASLAVIGPTGCGKTAGLAIPALLEWHGPILAGSVKTDLLQHTRRHREHRGDVQIYDPVTGAGTAGWDPTAHCGSWADAQRMAGWLCDAARPSSHNLTDADYWITQAAKALAPHLYAAHHDHRSIDAVVAWIDTQDEPELQDILNRSPHPDARAALQALNALWFKDDRLRSSVYATVEAVLLPYADPGVQAAARLPNLDFDGWLTGDHTVYLAAPAHEQHRLRPVFTVITQAALRAAYRSADQHGGSLPIPCLVLLDEAGNTAPIPDLATVATTARSHNITLITVWQDVAQLRARYGEGAGTVLNNHRARIFGGGIADEHTLRYLSTLLGEDHQPDRNHTTDLRTGHRSITEHPTRRPAAPPDTLRRLPADTALLLYGNQPALPLHLRPWYTHHELRRRAGR
jgi:type IV secretion system protein VirD4